MELKKTQVYKRIADLKERLQKAKEDVIRWNEEENEDYYFTFTKIQDYYSGETPPPEYAIDMQYRRALNSALLTAIEKNLDSLLVLTDIIEEHRQYKKFIVNALSVE